MSRTCIYKELNRFIQLDAEDIRRAQMIAPIVLSSFDTIADNVYHDMETDPRAVSAFRSRQRIEQHRESLREWVEESFSGIYDHKYYESRLINGQRHAEVSLFPHFVFGKMSLVRKHIVRAITMADLEPETMAGYIATANRIIDLDLAITIQSYWDALMISKMKVPLALSSGLAHEIRNPLNGMALNISLLERQLSRLDADTENTKPVLESIKAEVQRINSLTTEIMNFAKPLTVEATTLSARRMITDVINLQHEALRTSEISLKTTWIGSELIYADHDRLFQVLLNLLANAIEAIPERQELKEIHITVDNSNPTTTTIKLEDNGCGMPPEVRDRIFDLYYTTKPSGTGLGMAIVQKIIEAHHGMIRITSHVGSGTTIDIFLPRPMMQEMVG